MGAAAASLYFLFVMFLSVSADTNETDIHEVIPSYGLPAGLIPDNVKSYTLRDTGYFVIRMNSECYVKFDHLVWYSTEIRGKLSYGAVHEVAGIQVKKAFFWLSVSAIEASESDGTIKFYVGPFSETFPATRFEEIPECGSGTKSSPTSLLHSIY